MKYTEIIYLIKKIFTQDAIGNIVATETETKTYAMLKNVSIKEFYSGIEAGITPTYELQIRASNYHGEEEIKYNNQYYSVIRQIKKSITDIVLVVEKKAGDL